MPDFQPFAHLTAPNVDLYRAVMGAFVRGSGAQTLERDEPLDIVVTLPNATEAQRQAVHRLLGRPPRPGRALSVSLPAVDDLLRRSGAHPDGLASAVLELTGPLPAAVDLEALWDKAFGELTDPRLTEWALSLRASGLVKRLAAAPQSAAGLLATLNVVVRNLPSPGEPIGRFAARTTGDAHALDDRHSGRGPLGPRPGDDDAPRRPPRRGGARAGRSDR